MKLPNSEKAYVSEQKLTEYLLFETYAVGKSKAKYFRAIGYDRTNSDQLREALINIAKSYEIDQKVETDFGIKYIVDGQLVTPNGNTVRIRTILVVESADDPPRFVTAYPA